jgi:hypothetical protein
VRASEAERAGVRADLVETYSIVLELRAQHHDRFVIQISSKIANASVDRLQPTV